MTDKFVWSTAETALASTQVGYFNFEAALAGKSSETKRKYMDWIRLFYREVLRLEVTHPSAVPIEAFTQQVTPAAVEAWLGKYASEGHSKSGLGQARAAVVYLARMLVLSRQASSALWHDLKLVSLPDHAATAAYGESASERASARWLSPDEVRSLMETVRKQANENRAKRDEALIWLMVTLGLRRDEVAGLAWQNLTRRGGDWVLRVRGKRNKWRAVAVPQETILALQPWAEAVIGGKVKELPPGLLLRRVWRSGAIAEEGITGNAVWRIVTDAWEATGMMGKLAPHDLRRTAAAIALEAGATDREIQQMLGHSSIETTHRYLAPMRENSATYRIAQMIAENKNKNESIF